MRTTSVRRRAGLLGLVAAALVAPVLPASAGPRLPGRIAYVGIDGTIRTIRPDGSGRKDLSPVGMVTGVSVSPDGSRVAFSQQATQTTDPYFSDVWVAGADLRGATPVGAVPGTLASEPTWSPDGSRLAYVQGVPAGLLGIGYQQQLWVMNRDGTGRRPVVALPGAVERLEWAPKGDAVAFVVDGQETSAAIGVVHVDATAPLPALVTHPPMIGVDKPHWSPDARWLSFMDSSSLYVVRPDGTGLRRLGPGDSYPFNGGAVWSPDGRTLASCLTSGGSFFGGVSGSGLTLVDVARPGRTRVLGSDPCLAPSWSPDGRSLAVVEVGSQQSSLDVVDARTGRARELDTGVWGIGLDWGR